MATLIVALDRPGRAEALSLVDTLGDAVTHYKVGLELFTREGPPIVRELHERGRKVFLDLKFLDIPNTVAGAVASAAELGVHMITLHATGGAGMLRAAREACPEGGPLLMGVTLLTSFSADDVAETWGKELRSLRDEVGRLAEISLASGLDGVVASPLEVESLKRRHGADFQVVTPGIRPAGTDAGDQVRSATPAAAVAAGADYLVVGRPVHRAADPAAAARAILAEMSGTPLELA